MRILLISYNDVQKDGRLNELRRSLNFLGDVCVISNTSSDKIPGGGTLFAFQSSKKFSYIEFLNYCKAIAKENGPFDLIASDNRNCIIPALRCKNAGFGTCTLYDARELYILKEVKSLKSKIGCIIEKKCVSKFDVVTCANSFRAEAMVKLYGLNKTPIAFENIRRLEYSDLSEQECESKFGSLFIDNIYTNVVTTSGEALIRKADVLVEAIARLGEKYRLFLIGYEDEEGHKKIDEICRMTGWNNIIRYKWLSKSELKYIVSHCDIGIVNYSFQNTNNKYCASGKLYEFIFEGLPIVTTSNPPLSQLCSEHEIGISDDSFYEGIKTVVSDYKKYSDNVKRFGAQVRIEENAEKVAEQIRTQLLSVK